MKNIKTHVTPAVLIITILDSKKLGNFSNFSKIFDTLCIFENDSDKNYNYKENTMRVVNATYYESLEITGGEVESPECPCH